MSFTTSEKSITLRVSIPKDIIDYINSLLLDLEGRDLEEKSAIRSLFITLIENLYLNRYRKVLTKLYLSKSLFSSF